MSLCSNYKKRTYSTQNHKSSLSVKKEGFIQFTGSVSKARGTSQYACHRGSMTVEAALVMPFFACFLVFILYFFRILQVQAGVAQSLQYTGRRMAAECWLQESGIDANTNVQETEIDGSIDVQESGGEGSGLETVGGLLKAKIYFQKQLEKQSCPIKYISHGISGIHFLQSDLSGNYVELKATYQMKFPVRLLGNIQYQVAQGVKCRKWTGYRPGEDDEGDDIWLYYTEYGIVYHASRSCSHLDLSIQGVSYAQVNQMRNQSGGKYYPCEKCGSETIGNMVYITNYGNCYHTGLTCSGLKRKIYMIRKSKATDKRMCKKCGK